MASIHIWKAQDLARRKGGFAGKPENADLWELSKRELVEIVLHFGARCGEDCDSYEDALHGDGARQAVLSERDSLKNMGIL